MKTVIISGAAGFVGYHLIKNLQEKGIFVIALCRPGSSHNRRLKEFTNLKIIECDTSHFFSLKEGLQNYYPDVFFHLAWEGTTGEKRGNYAIQLANVKDICDTYTLAALLGCKKFIATGTIYECLAEQVLLAEQFNSLSYYVLAKKYAYESLFQLSKKLKLDLTWCMFCQPIGKYIKLDQLMAYLVYELKEGRIPKLGTAENPFDMIVVEDLAEGLYLAGIHNLKNKKYYIGSERPRQLKEYLKKAGELVAPEIELVFGQRASDGLQFSYDWLDSTSFRQETGFFNSYRFEDGVRNVAKWVEECN